jgi:hypothetical protein
LKKKAATILIVLAAVMIALALGSFSVASARAASSYSIESVNHTVDVLYNGYVLINDTISISGQTNSFSLGFPYTFGPSVLEAFAYNTNNTSNMFPVTLNVPMEDLNGTMRPGFYGAEVDFSSGAPPIFSVVFVLSNSVLVQDSTNSTVFTLTFPAFPSLTENVPVCNSSVNVPDALYYNGTVSSFGYDAQNLSAFTYNTSQVGFLLPEQDVQVFEIQQLTRQVSLSAFGQIGVSDSYHITNNSTYTMESVEVDAPPNASNLSASNALGSLLVTPVVTATNLTRYMVNFSLPVAPSETGIFTVSYNLPAEAYVNGQGSNFVFDMTFFQEVNTYIDQASVSFVLPEGAQLSSFNTSLAKSYRVDRSVFGETMTVNQENVISLSSFTVSLGYVYNPLWLAYVPTMLIWALSVVGSTVGVVVWRRPKGPSEVFVPSTALRLRLEDVRSFLDAYDEKMKIEMEIDILEERVQKGRVPRPRYKVQRKTLDTRLSTLNRTLAELGGKMHAAGGHYSDLMRQLEVAETEIDGVEANLKSIEARQSRAEISYETYRKLRGDYERRKERAKTTINGILLRLREEIR